MWELLTVEELTFEHTMIQHGPSLKRDPVTCLFLCIKLRSRLFLNGAVCFSKSSRLFP